MEREIEYLKIVLKMLSNLIVHTGGCLVALDLRCGSSWLTRRIARLCSLVVGIDVKASSEWTKSRHPNLEFIVADARSLPLRPNAVYFVVAISLLEHVLGWDKVIPEVHHVLRRRGLFVVQLPSLTYIIEPHTKLPLLGLLPRRLRAMLVSSVGYKDLQFSRKLRNVAKELERHGFKYWVSSYHYILRSSLLLSQPFLIMAIKMFEAIKEYAKR